MDTIRQVLRATKQTDKPRMLVRVETVEKMLADYDEAMAMLTAFRHASNSIGKAAKITKDHVAHDVAEASVCGDAYYLELIRGAEQRLEMQSSEIDQLKAQVERLRTGLFYIASQSPIALGDETASWMKNKAAGALKETPAQSLATLTAEHDAQLLEEFGNNMLAVNNDDNLIGTAETYEYYQSVAEDAFQEAARIRNEANGVQKDD